MEYGYADVVVAVSIQESWCIHWPNGEYERLLEFIKRFSSLLTAIAFLIMLFEYSVIPSGIKPFIDIKRENNFVETMSQRIYLICTASEMILWRQENSLGYTIDTHHMQVAVCWWEIPRDTELWEKVVGEIKQQWPINGKSIQILQLLKQFALIPSIGTLLNGIKTQAVKIILIFIKRNIERIV